jgi:hypothetical protein
MLKLKACDTIKQNKTNAIKRAKITITPARE